MKDHRRTLLLPTWPTNKSKGFLKLMPGASILRDLFPWNAGCDLKGD